MPSEVATTSWISSSGNSVTANTRFISRQNLAPNHSNFITIGRTAVGM